MNVCGGCLERFLKVKRCSFAMENWQVVAVVEIANLQRPRKKITVEYLA